MKLFILKFPSGSSHHLLEGGVKSREGLWAENLRVLSNILDVQPSRQVSSGCELQTSCREKHLQSLHLTFTPEKHRTGFHDIYWHHNDCIQLQHELRPVCPHRGFLWCRKNLFTELIVLSKPAVFLWTSRGCLFPLRRFIINIYIFLITFNSSQAKWSWNFLSLI